MRAGMTWGIAALGAAGVVLGCNAVLGIQDVRPEDVAGDAAVDAAADDTGARDAARDDAARDATPPPDAGSEVSVPDSGLDCPDGGKRCNGTCTDTTKDPSNCGTCGQKCNGGETCGGAAGCQCNGAAGCYRGLYCSVTGCSSWASWPMPNPVAEPAVPNHASYDTSSVDVVVDRVTGLTWERVMDGVTRTLSDSKLYCAGLTLAGKNDWRVPTRIELVSLLDFTRATPPTIDPVAFPNTISGYWSSSPMAGDPTLAWGVNFGGGYTYRLYVTTTNHVRCVR